MSVSQNGWVAGSLIRLKPLPWITGSVRAGDVWVVMDFLCAMFDARVERINPAHSWGYAYRAVRGAVVLSNHASGTAVDLNAPKHPLGAVGTFTPTQRVAIRGILTELGGVVRWGGDYTGRKDEMHFEIVAPANKVAAVARRLTAQKTNETPKEKTMKLTDKIKLGKRASTLLGMEQQSVGGALQYAAASLEVGEDVLALVKIIRDEQRAFQVNITQSLAQTLAPVLVKELKDVVSDKQADDIAAAVLKALSARLVG